MIFEPKVDDTIIIYQTKYKFLWNEATLKDLCLVNEHEGGEGIVYQVSSVKNPSEFYALKTFNKNLEPSFAESINDSMSKSLEYKNLSGLRVFDRKLVRSSFDCPEVQQYTELQNSVLMPWIFGNTWHDVIGSYQKDKQSLLPNSFDRSLCLKLSKSIAFILAGLEENGLAHCDISSLNIIFDLSKDIVELVDVEDMYFPNSDIPAQKTIGSNGYKHPNTKGNTWFAEGDRFAGAVLICEILAWSNPEIRELVEDDTFFSNEEFGEDCKKYQIVKEELSIQYSTEITNLFNKVWFSNDISDCPPFSEWVKELSRIEQPQLPVLIVSPLSLDFGRIDKQLSQNLLIRNNGKLMLRGTISETDNSWLSIQQRAFELQPQETCSIEIVAFSPSNFIADSLLENKISIFSNRGNQSVKVSGKAGNSPKDPSPPIPNWLITGCILLVAFVMLLILLVSIPKQQPAPIPSPIIENVPTETIIPINTPERILDSTPTKTNPVIIDVNPIVSNTNTYEQIPSNYECPDLAKINLQIGATGRVGKYDINLRKEPIVPKKWDANVVIVLREGEELKILGGPQCSHDGTWWEVRTKSHLIGWVRENQPSKGTLVFRIEP
jgi:serine/threonine protein kinase